MDTAIKSSLKQTTLDNLKIPPSIKEIRLVVKNLPTKKTPGQIASQ